MTPDEHRRIALDLLEFTKYIFAARKHAEFKVAPHHRRIADELHRVVKGQTKRLIINVPPRSGKTELAVKHFIAWAMGICPDAEFIHASYSKRLATTNTWETRAIMQHEAYSRIFAAPRFYDDSNAKDEFRTRDGGIVYATGAEGTITGYGAGKMRPYFGGAIIVDDPHKAGEGNSEVMRRNVIDWFGTTMESRKNSPDTPIIIIMQRLHEMDLTGWLLSGGNGEHWRHVCIPARDNSDNSFWPEQFPAEMLDRLERSNAYVFAGQYMQRPAPIGGGIFKDQWWQFYTVAPPLEWRTIYADTAQKTAQHNDYSVFQCWGKGHHGQIVILDQIRGKWEAPELLVQARAFWRKHADARSGAPLRSFKVEDAVSGTGLIQSLQREGIPITGIRRERDKVTRALDAAPMIEAGHVHVPRDAPWLADYLAEFAVFPNGAHDDQIDPTLDAIADMAGQFAQPGISYI